MRGKAAPATRPSAEPDRGQHTDAHHLGTLNISAYRSRR